jgi:hypothetical protein
MIRSLLEILRRENLMQNDDYEAFESVIFENEKISGTNFLMVSAQYQAIAKALGIPDPLGPQK